MRYTIKRKMSNTGSIYDLASSNWDREIVGRGKYAVVLAAYYGGKGYTTHLTAKAAVHESKQQAEYGHKIIDEEGYVMVEDGDRLVRSGDRVGG